MKVFYAICLLLLLANEASAQDYYLKGLTVHATTELYIEANEPKSGNVDQVYTISFTDKLLTHIIYSSTTVTDSQIYRVENVTNTNDVGNTILKFDALSGVSGNKFKYELRIDKDGKLVSFKLTTPKGDITVYKGVITKLKTFVQ